MRILIAIGVARQKEAGAAGVVLNHARELEKLGHHVECWFLDDILRRPVRPRRFESLAFGVSVARRVLKERNNYDVVNLHAPWGCVYGFWRSLFHPAGSPPYVMTMQGSEERYVETMRVEHGKGRAWNFAWKNRVWHRIYHQTMYDYSIRSADYGMVANREGWIMAELKHGRGFGRTWFVPNGTEERFVQPHDYQDRSPLRLLYVGSWLDRKGVYYLADVMASLCRTMPDVRLTVAGCAASDGEVKKYFAPEVRDRVCVVPFVKREDMPAVYHEHDIFVFPSLVEGMPLTLLEAMAAGMPVVTTNTSGMADVVDDGINGLLVPGADAESLKVAIERLVSCAALRKQLGLAAQEKMQRYTWTQIAKEVERILSLAARGGRS